MRSMHVILVFMLCTFQLVISYQAIKRNGRPTLREKFHVSDSVDTAVYRQVEEDAADDLTIVPTVVPSARPTVAPTRAPSAKPSGPTHSPSHAPTLPPNAVNHPPPCITDESQIAYVNGMISATQTLYNCLANIADPYNIPTFYNGSFNGIMIVNTSLQLNNLHDIDAVASTATLDFYLRLYWQDNRLAMPLFWSKMSKTVQSNGVELTLILTNSSIGLWVPDVRFHDASELDYIVQTIRVNASNIIFWSRHTLATFMQPLLNFKEYPSDTQCINIRYGSFAYSQSYFKMNYWVDPLTFNTNYNGEYTFTANPIWTYDNSSTNSTTVSPSYYTTYVSSSGFLNSIYHIYVRRKGGGIVVRLVLPITLLLILSGLTFWANYENRVDSTTTLLLSVSALYIVILSNIPLLGYLTAIDQYVFWMFLLLVIVVAMHQTYSTIHDKTDQWPLRIWYKRTIEFLGRTCVFLSVVLYYLREMKDIPLTTKYTMMVIVLTCTGAIAVREFLGVKKAFLASLGGLLTKLNKPDVKIDQLSQMEILVFNYWYFRTLSLKLDLISEYLHKMGDFDDPNKHTLDLRHLYAMRESTFGASDVSTPVGADGATSGEIMMQTYQSNVRSLSVAVGSSAVNPMAHTSSSDAPAGSPRPGSIHRVNQHRSGPPATGAAAGREEVDSGGGGIRMSIDHVYDSDDES